MFEFDLAWIVSGLLLIPYFLWGIYLLRQRLVYHVELDRAIETFTIACLFFFFVFEFTLLKAWLGNSQLKLIFASMGLVASALALYGPLVVSFSSHLVVDLVMPARVYTNHVPQYGVAESCELRGDYEAAAREFAAVARMFPRETKAALRAGENLMKLDRPADAVQWLELALRSLETDEECLPVVNRLFEIYRNKLDRPDDARRMLDEFLDDFPTSDYAPSVKERIASLSESNPISK